MGHLRASEEAELLGMDDDQLGEFAYDYVEVRRDYLAWTPATDEPEKTESNINPSDRHGIPQHSEMINGQSPEGAQADMSTPESWVTDTVLPPKIRSRRSMHTQRMGNKMRLVICSIIRLDGDESSFWISSRI